MGTTKSTEPRNIPVVGLFNNKGGVGKTTTAHNLAFGLANAGYKILLMDLDPQANLSLACNITPGDDDPSITDVALGTDIQEALHPLADNLQLLPSHPSLAGFDTHFAGKARSEYVVQRFLSPYIYNVSGPEAFDMVIIDCPPSLSLISMNAFACMTHVIIPVQMQFFSMAGLQLLGSTIDEWARVGLLRPEFQILGYLGTFYGSQLALTKAVHQKIFGIYDSQVFKTCIRVNTHLAEAPSHFKDIFSYKPNSIGAEDYGKLVNEVIKRLALKRRK